jgi:hypothetical protein
MEPTPRVAVDEVHASKHGAVFLCPGCTTVTLFYFIIPFQLIDEIMIIVFSFDDVSKVVVPDSEGE